MAVAVALRATGAAAHTISGVVVGPNGPIAKATVELHYESNPGAVGHRAVTSGDGRFSGPAPDGQILFIGAQPPAGAKLATFYDGQGLQITRDTEVRIVLQRIVRVQRIDVTGNLDVEFAGRHIGAMHRLLAGERPLPVAGAEGQKVDASRDEPSVAGAQLAARRRSLARLEGRAPMRSRGRARPRRRSR